MSFAPKQLGDNRTRGPFPVSTKAQRQQEKALERNAALKLMGKSMCWYASHGSDADMAEKVPVRSIEGRLAKLGQKLQPEERAKVLEGVNEGMMMRGERPVVNKVFNQHKAKG